MRAFLYRYGSELLALGYAAGCFGGLAAVMLTLKGHGELGALSAFVCWLGFSTMIAVAVNDFSPSRQND